MHKTALPDLTDSQKDRIERWIYPMTNHLDFGDYRFVWARRKEIADRLKKLRGRKERVVPSP